MGRFGHAASRAAALASELTPCDKGVSFDHTGSIFLAAHLPESAVAEVTRFGIYDPGAPTAVEDPLHVTLVFLGKDPATQRALPDVVRLIELVTRKHRRLTATLAGFGWFNPGEDGVPYFGLISCPGLGALQADLQSALSSAVELPSKHGFVPHMTLGYAEKAEDIELPALDAEVSVAWPVDEIQLCVGGEVFRRFALRD